MDLNLVKDNIDYEQSIGENSQDIVIKEEYVIPDTLPDVSDILMLNAKPLVVNKEVMNGKVLVEFEVDFNVLYMNKEEDNTEAHAVNYTTKISANVDADGATADMNCDSNVDIEHIQCMIVNERKICIQGVANIACNVIKKNTFEIVKDVESDGDLQFLKQPMILDKVIGSFEGEMIGKTELKIDMDRPEIGKIVKYFITLGKKEVRLYDGGIHLECVANLQILYKGKNSKEVICISENIPITKELEIDKIKNGMEHNTDFTVHSFEYDIKEDDMGENRILDIEFLVKTITHVMAKEEIEMIEDAYCPTKMVKMDKEEFNINVIQGQNQTETLAKGDIEIANDMPKPSKVIMTTADVNITDKKLMDDKILVEGVLKADVLYSTGDDKEYLACASDEIPFSTTIDIDGAKIDMDCICKLNLEMLESSIEAGNVCVRAIIKGYGIVSYPVKQKFLVEMNMIEGEIPQKKASVTIYVVQKDDNLWKICKRYYTTKEKILNINGIENEKDIKPMDKLIIPGRAVI